MNLLPRLFLIPLALFCIRLASASPVTWQFNGSVSGLGPDLNSIFSLGDTVTGSITFETDTPGTPHWDVPGLTVFSGAVTDFTFSIGSYNVTTLATHQINAMTGAGAGIVFTTAGDENDPVGDGVSGFIPRQVSAQFRNYGIQNLSDVFALGAPTSHNSLFRLDFSPPGGGNGSVALLAEGILASGPPPIVTAPSNVQEGGQTIGLLACGLLGLSLMRRRI